MLGPVRSFVIIKYRRLLDTIRTGPPCESEIITYIAVYSYSKLLISLNNPNRNMCGVQVRTSIVRPDIKVRRLITRMYVYTIVSNIIYRSTSLYMKV